MSNIFHVYKDTKLNIMIKIPPDSELCSFLELGLGYPKFYRRDVSKEIEDFTFVKRVLSTEKDDNILSLSEYFSLRDNNKKRRE